MALRDPGLIEFARLIDTETLATAFAREHRLLLSDQQLAPVNNENNKQCALGTAGCRGSVHRATKKQSNRNKNYEGLTFFIFFLLTNIYKDFDALSVFVFGVPRTL